MFSTVPYSPTKKNYISPKNDKKRAVTPKSERTPTNKTETTPTTISPVDKTPLKLRINTTTESSSSLNQSTNYSYNEPYSSPYFRVICRIRPPSEMERERDRTGKYSNCFEIQNENTTIVTNEPIPKTFHFDRIFHTTSNQNDLYEESCLSIVDDILSGINTTVIAYGQTGSGKVTQSPLFYAKKHVSDLIFLYFE